MKNDHAMQELAKAARFEAGKPADPTKNMSPEDAQKWKDMNEEHRDNFKTASSSKYELYDRPGWEKAEKAIDDMMDKAKEHLTKAYKGGSPFQQAAGMFEPLLKEYLEFGTGDGEPFWAIERELTKHLKSLKAPRPHWDHHMASTADLDLIALDVMANGPSTEVIGTMLSKVAVGDIPADVERYVKETKESNPDYDDAKVWAVAWSRYCKYKNPGSEHCHMNTNDYFKNATEALTKMAAGRPLSEIADEIYGDWQKVYFGAVPYLDAMSSMKSIDDDYGLDSGSSIVAYFLANASGWKGDTAKKVKKELQDMLKKSRKYANDPDLQSLVVACGEGVMAEGCPDNLEGEDCDKWESNTDKYKDVVKDKHQAGQVNDTTKSEPDNSMRKNPLDPMANWNEGEIDLKDDPRNHPSEGSMIPGLEDRLAAEAKFAMDFATPEALKKYLHDHPDADKSKHHVKKEESDSDDGRGEVGKKAGPAAFARHKEVQKLVGNSERLYKRFESLTSYRAGGKDKEGITKALDELHSTAMDAKKKATDAIRQIQDIHGSDIERVGPQNGQEGRVFKGIDEVAKVMKSEKDKPLENNGGTAWEVKATVDRIKAYASFVEDVKILLYRGTGKAAADPMMAELEMLAEGCPDNLDEGECKAWEANTDKYRDVVKDKHQAGEDKTAETQITIGHGPHGYIARYKNKEIAVMAKTTYEAQLVAAQYFKAKKPWEVDVGLAEMDGKPVTHLPLMASESLDDQWNAKTAALAPTGLYGYTRAIQSSCESSIRKMTATATQLAKEAYRKDENVAPFLAAHAKRGNSLSAKILVAAMKTIGPKVASEMRKAELLAEALPADKLTKAAARKYGLYGYAAKTASLGLQACTTMRETAGHVTAEMHGRKAADHKLITGFLSSHAKEAKCMYSKMLCASYPDADRKTASVVAPTTVGEWLTWED